MEDLKTYFLFGSTATWSYFDNDFETFLKGLEPNEGYATFEYDDSMNVVTDYAEAYDGWDGYAVITKEEYEAINKLSYEYSFSDLSINPERYPTPIVEITGRLDQMHADGQLDYSDLQRGVELCEEHGWTFEYGLDLSMDNLRKL